MNSQAIERIQGSRGFARQHAHRNHVVDLPAHRTANVTWPLLKSDTIPAHRLRPKRVCRDTAAMESAIVEYTERIRLIDDKWAESDQIVPALEHPATNTAG